MALKSGPSLARRRIPARSYSTAQPVVLNSLVQTPGNQPYPNKLRNFVFLHGLFGSSTNWRTISSHVSTSCLQNCHLLDARNHGSSPHSSDMSYESMSEDLKLYVDSNKLGRINLLGHSMGGKFAMHFATTYPEYVDKLIIVDVAPIKYPERTSIRKYINGMKTMDLSTIHSRKEADQVASAFIPEPLVRSFILQNLVSDNGGSNTYKWRINLQAIDKSLADILAGPTLKGKFYGKTLFIGGTQSDYIPPEAHSVIYELFPKATIKMIPDAGHYVHYEKQSEFIKLVTDFINLEL